MAFQWATFQHFTSTIWKGLVVYALNHFPWNRLCPFGVLLLHSPNFSFQWWSFILYTFACDYYSAFFQITIGFPRQIFLLSKPLWWAGPSCLKRICNDLSRVWVGILRWANLQSIKFPSALQVKVYLAPKHFFAKINLCTCSKSTAPFFALFPQMLAFYRLPNIRKGKYHLVHDGVRRGVGLFLIWRHKLIQRLNAMQISLWRQIKNRPTPLLSRSCTKWYLLFRMFRSI